MTEMPDFANMTPEEHRAWTQTWLDAPLEDIEPFMRMYDMDSKPFKTRREAYDALQERDQKRVALTQVGQWTVSTVNLYMDHSFGMREGPPLHFETMVFGGGDDKWEDDLQDRYHTKEEAREGHEGVVKAIMLIEGIDTREELDEWPTSEEERWT